MGKIILHPQFNKYIYYTTVFHTQKWHKMTGFYFGRQSLYFPSYTHTSESHAKTWSPVPSHQEDCIDASIIFWMVCHLGIFAWKVQWRNIIMKNTEKNEGHRLTMTLALKNKTKNVSYWAVQARLLTPLTFARHCFSPLAAFTSCAYFLHNGRLWQWICKFYTSNFKDIFGGP